MTALRISFALAWKNLLHHGMSFAGAFVLFASMVLVGWVVVLGEEQTSLMGAATGVFYYIGPLLIIFINDRLVARDLQDGTSEFLSALPVGGFVRLAVPFALGLFVILAVAEFVLLSTAMLASRREGIPFLWLLQLHLQAGLYLLAWHGIAFAVVHTGRWRWLVWWTLFNVLFALDGSWFDRPFRTVFWHAPLADPVEQSRSIPPWDAIPIALAWTMLGVAIAFFLGTWRGGTLPARWYGPASTRARGALIVGAVLIMATSQLIEDAAPAPDTWRTLAPLPATHADVRIAGTARLDQVGRDSVAMLDELAEKLEVDRWPTVVLHPASRGLNRHVRRATGADESLVLLVDPSGPRAALARAIVTEVLLRQTGDLADRVPGVDWLAHGAAGWLRPDPVLDDRFGLVPDPSLPYAELVERHGTDLAEAVAVKQIEALGEAATCALGWPLGHTRGSDLFSSVRLRWEARAGWLQQRCGVSAPALAPRSSPLHPPPLPPLRIVVEGDSLFAVLDWPAPTGSVLRRQAIDPLEHQPSFGAQWRVQDVSGSTRVHLGYSPTQNALAELTLYWEPIDGWLSSGWGRP